MQNNALPEETPDNITNVGNVSREEKEETTQTQASKETTVLSPETPSEDENEEPEWIPPYNLSDTDRDYIVRVVLAEARGEGVIGQMAIAQCILDGAQYYETDPVSLCKKLGYASPWSGAGTDEARFSSLYSIASDAVSRVFDMGSRVTPSRIIFFYAPKRCTSAWHESQNYITTIGNHKFFDIKESED